jgi:NitT/TauT family transport system substrate-binding protein
MSPRRLATATLGLVLLLAACASPSPSASPSSTDPASPASSGSAEALRPVRLLLGFRPDVQFAAFYLAKQRGYFAEAGLEVTIEHSNDVMRLVADGQAEFGVADATDLMIARTAGIPITYVHTLYARFPVALIGSAGIVPAEPSELAGLRIGTPGRFGSSWHALLALLDAGGLTPDDVTIREYPAFNQVEGLLNGDVDLITGFRVNEPLQLAAQGFDAELLTVDELVPLPGPGIVVGDELLTSDRDLASDFARAVVRAQENIALSVDAGLEAAIAEVPTIGENRETARAVLEATVELWLDEDGRVGTGLDDEVWRAGYATMRDLGLIDGSVPLDEMTDNVLVSRL